MTEQEQPTTQEPPTQVPVTWGAVESPSGIDEFPAARPPIAWTRVATLTARIAILVVVASVALGGAAVAAASFYSQYGAVRNAPNARAWSGLTPHFAGQAICVSCHEPEANAQDASVHVNVSCEGCHGPLAAHSRSDEAAKEIAAAKPEEEICATCHVAVAGRPDSFPQLDLAKHYSGDRCARCHDPHSITADRPPTVSHPLADLPVCTTCHAPEGLKEIPSGHEPVGDAICLACHHPTDTRRP